LEHVVEISSRGHATDYYGMSYHGRTFTHIDALGHIFDSRGVFLSEGEMYNGRQALEEASSSGLAFGGIHALRAGIITRGVLLDIPALRGIPYVAPDDPVRESDLLEAASRQGISVEPGDGLVVYCGREAFETDFGMMGSSEMVPGLHTSCLRYLRNSDVGVLLWDMHDHRPPEYGFDFGVHFVLPLFGLPLVDNCSLEELVEACRRAMRYEFAVVIAPLDVVGGTGSPVNPLALL
jgi:kynurenine formamidase